jgi:formamidopyrimidine-DNA glycosylase
VVRYGKQVLWKLDDGFLMFKLGMTGAILLDRDRGPYTRAELLLDGPRVLFDDIRQFGSVVLLDRAPATLGPDPLEITSSEFARRLRERDTGMKALLLDQNFVRGLGNIYTDEALFRAEVHPLARSRKLSRARAEQLHAVIVELLEEAIAHRGSSISDYVDADGARGAFQLRHQVYGRQGQACVRCGGEIQRIVVGQRGTHCCRRCQRR